MRFSHALLAATVICLPRPLYAAPQVVQTRPVLALTSAGAEQVLQAAERLAAVANDPAAIAIVDADGLLLAFARMDDVRPGSVDLAIGKARSAALMQRPTAELEANVASGRVGLATAGLTTLRGGAPLKIDGKVIGAVGVAGTNKEDDEKTAAETAQAFAQQNQRLSPP